MVAINEISPKIDSYVKYIQTDTSEKQVHIFKLNHAQLLQG